MTDSFAPPPAPPPGPGPALGPAGPGDSMIRPPGRAVTVASAAVLGVGALVLMQDAPGGGMGVLTGMVIVAIATFRNGVELTPTHLVHHIGLRRKAYVWSDIVAIGPRGLLGGENAAITLQSGKRVNLAAPRRGLRAVEPGALPSRCRPAGGLLGRPPRPARPLPPRPAPTAAVNAAAPR